MTLPVDHARAVETLATLADDESRAAYLSGRPDLVCTDVAERLVEASRAHLHVDRQRSRTLGAAAEAIARRLGDDRLIGLGLRAQANALWASGASAAAADRHELALRLFESLGDEAEIARTLNASIQPLILVGRYEEAIRAAARARDIFARTGDALRLARLEINLGNVFHRQDRFEEALEHYDRALQGVRASGDVEGTLSALHNTAVTLTSLTRFPEALAIYEAARTLAVERQMPLAVAQTDYNVAWLYYLRGEYARAIDLLRAAADTSDRHADAYHAALCRLDLSEVYLELGLNDEARELAQQAHAMFSDLGVGYEAAKALANTAVAYGREGQVGRAMELFDRAHALFVGEANYAWPSLIDLYRAVLLLEDDRPVDARRLADAALSFFANTALAAKTALCLVVQGRIGLRLRDLDAAERAGREALRQLAEFETPALTYAAHLLLGQVQATRGDRARARQSYEAARRDFDTLRGRLRGDELKIAFGRDKQELYQHLAALCLDEGTPDAIEEAFQYAEQAKCRSLLDLVARPLTECRDVGDERTSAAARRIRALREELNWYYHEIEREELRESDRHGPRPRPLQLEAAARERELARLLRDMPAADAPQIERHQSTAATLDELRAALPDDAVLLEYFQIQGRFVLWLATREHLRVVPLGDVGRLKDRVRRLQFQLEKLRLGAEYTRAFESLLLASVQAHLGELHRELLGAVWNEIQGRHVLVVPHGVLHYVPFHALFDGRGYVIDRCSVSYAPSAGIYALVDRQPAHGVEGPLVLAVPDDRAPLIENEAREVAAVLPGAALHLGSDATRRILETEGRSSRIVHVASHGHFRPDNPMFSTIRLGDGHLNVYDLYHLTLPAELVTFSGCATGQTIAAEGDEILGIARGLFCAGAHSLLLTLWDVHDASTTAFMGAFYRTLLESGDMAGAARTAMLHTRERHPHPYFWAPFVLMGRFRRRSA
jgi:CHAT domain-containing protein/tetratricopeptide (TPR) repeat protein